MLRTIEVDVSTAVRIHLRQVRVQLLLLGHMGTELSRGSMLATRMPDVPTSS